MNELPPVISLNSSTISANDIDLFYKTKKDFSKGISRIDLHRYSVKNAQYTVKRIIEFFYYNQYCNTILFITGRGKHANNKGERGILFKLFPQWLEDENISHMIEKCEPRIGAYKVTLKKNNIESPLGEPLNLVVNNSETNPNINIESPLVEPLNLVVDNSETNTNINIESSLGEPLNLVVDNSETNTNINIESPLEEPLNLVVNNSETNTNIYEPEQNNLVETSSDAISDVQQSTPLELVLKSEFLHSLAEMDLPNYQFYLGVKYHTGDGIKKDDKEAAKWFRKAAEQGLSSAQFMLGFLYMIGMGVQHDIQQGLHWYHLAARQNDPIAMRNIAYHHLTEKDYKNAKDWFCKAYEAGNAESANQIGIMYSLGKGNSRDLQKAEEWFRKSAEAGDSHGKTNLGAQLLENGNKEGVKWIREAAIEGIAVAQLHLGEVYYLQGDVDEGKKWFLESAIQNAGKPSGHAQFILGSLTNDSKQKLEWYRKAADNDIKLAQKELAKMHRSGSYGLKKDCAKAIKLYNAAAKTTKHYGYDEKGNQYAQYSLGECYELGLLKVKKNPKKALNWYKEAAKQGYMMALTRLGIIQENNLTLTEIQERLKGIHTLPTSKELENVDILIYLNVYSHSTRSYTFKRKTDKLNSDDEICGYMFFKRAIMSTTSQSVMLQPVETSAFSRMCYS
ncbi:10889_t:CDS:1, partial [Acaulospora morrowiae]